MAAANSRRILVRLDNGSWVPANDYQQEAFISFNRVMSQDNVEHYNNNGYKFDIMRLSDDFKQDSNGGTYIIREDGSRMPIADWNDVNVFVTVANVTRWHSSRDYQTWAYMHYIYSNANQIGYYSIGTHNPPNGYVRIPIQNISPNIVFLISRNNNGTIFYETDDVPRIRNRISDNRYYRSGYQAYINRIIDDASSYEHKSQVSQVSQVSQEFPRPSGVIDTPTEDDDKMCNVCNNFEQNIKFLPCNHENTCYSCYSYNYKLHKINQCPFCRQQITKIEKKDDKKDGKSKYLKYKQKYFKLKYELF